MPGRGEGFGFVFLEAMACGVPVVGSKLDGSREALRDGELGLLVDPDDSDALADAVLTALQQPKAVPPGLEYFSFPRFAERLGEIVRKYV
jgi:glycosyltransferase involved in cell wall biosynthesis